MNNSTSMKDMSYQAVMGRNNEIMKMQSDWITLL